MTDLGSADSGLSVCQCKVTADCLLYLAMVSEERDCLDINVRIHDGVTDYDTRARNFGHETLLYVRWRTGATSVWSHVRAKASIVVIVEVDGGFVCYLSRSCERGLRQRRDIRGL